MTNFLDSAVMSYVVNGIISAAAVGITSYLHKAKQKVESEVSTILPVEEATKVNDFLDTVERFTEAAVQNANSLIVSGLKEKSLFTQDTAAAIKQAVISEVLKNLGPLAEKGAALVGPLESIIGQMVEKYVLKSKVA